MVSDTCLPLPVLVGIERFHLDNAAPRCLGFAMPVGHVVYTNENEGDVDCRDSGAYVGDTYMIAPDARKVSPMFLGPHCRNTDSLPLQHGDRVRDPMSGTEGIIDASYVNRATVTWLDFEACVDMIDTVTGVTEYDHQVELVSRPADDYAMVLNIIEATDHVAACLARE